MPDSPLTALRRDALRHCDAVAARLFEDYRPRSNTPGPSMSRNFEALLVSVRRDVMHGTDEGWMAEVRRVLVEWTTRGAEGLCHDLRNRRLEPIPPHPFAIVRPDGPPPQERAPEELYFLDGDSAGRADPLRRRSTAMPRVDHRRYVISLTPRSLVYWRNVMGLTKGAAAKWCGVSAHRWREWEVGERAVQLKVAARIYCSLGIRTSVHDLEAHEFQDTLHDVLTARREYFREKPVSPEAIWYLVEEQIEATQVPVLELTVKSETPEDEPGCRVYEWAHLWWLQGPDFKWQGPYEPAIEKMVAHPTLLDALKRGWVVRGTRAREFERHAARSRRAAEAVRASA